MSTRLYSLCYRLGGSFEGLALIEADSLPDALLRAELEEIDPGGDCEGQELAPDEARVIPRKFIGRLLDEDQATELERILLANVRKKPTAPSTRRRWSQQSKRAGLNKHLRSKRS
jgi:hypothetical protein